MFNNLTLVNRILLIGVVSISSLAGTVLVALNSLDSMKNDFNTKGNL